MSSCLRPWCRSALFLCLLSCGNAVSSAQPLTSGTLDSDAATAYFLAHSPHVRALRATGQIAEAGVTTAGTRPNPTFAYELESLPGRGGVQASTQQAFKLSQPLLLGGKLAARRESARREVTRSAAEVEQQVFVRTVDFRRRFFETLSAALTAESLSESLAAIRKVQGLVERRLREGLAARYDFLRLRAEAGQLEGQQRGAELDLAGQRTLLAGLMGFTSAAAMPLPTGELEPPGLGPEALGPLEDHPELVELECDLALARSRLRLARCEAAPQVSVFGGSLTFDQGPDQRGFTAGLSVDLPLSDRRQGERQEASARMAALELKRASLALALKSRRQACLSVYEGEHRRVHEFREHFIGTLDEVLRTVSASYAEGRHSLIDLLDGLRLHRESRLTYLRQVAAARKAFLELEEACGHLLPESARPSGPR
ncbi:MAG: TolC family protein [Candidatus Riflebacteria bacterium]|nr:TolC family protein [Candidatus Riflebacteria bacterium]